MLNFLRWPKRKLPPMFKCVWCERRPGEVMHHHIPLCRTCASTLRNDISLHGQAVIAGLEDLRQTTDTDVRAELADRIIEHAGKLVRYEDQHLQTILPEPTVVIHKVRTQETDDLVVETYDEDETNQ
ncbi:hypothetical protein [Alicyclobacillus sp. ALC3]|uniref:hypothetical protein n=1 Tax=Alicyclobacillus sp. ALC3 TaxID=2796143 RepID=UPI0023786AA4|nr:hypothetical protein [Alicyclobacillus sp. ALC3]WDL95700.1 hypothetical protein JC200_15145 [Alicyclobacillus sp. ALC3]